jgi:amino-acid N-acetyltransferase
MIRKAGIKDVKKIQELINYYAGQDKMLSRSLSELYENIRDFFVYEDDGKIIGCAALHIMWEDLAEIKSLAVAESSQNKKIGSSLIRAALEESGKLDIKRVFVLSYVPEFFEKFGFNRIEHAELPHKIWSECIKCVKFPDCNEIALAINL